MSSGSHAQQDQKDHHADAVVEERLARDLHLEAAGNRCLLQDGEHRDRVGRRDQRPEQQAREEGQADSEGIEREPGARADEERGECDAEGGQECDDPLLLQQIVEVYVQRAREEQKGEHSFEQRGSELDFRVPARPLEADQSERAESDHDEREGEGDDEHPDRGGQADHPVVQVAEEGGQRDQERCEGEELHAQRSATVSAVPFESGRSSTANWSRCSSA